MAEEDDTETPVPAEKRKPGPLTLMTSAAKIAEERARQERDREDEKDKYQEARTDGVWKTALDTANQRAEDAKAELDRKDKNWSKALSDKAAEHTESMASVQRMVRFQWLIIALLIGAVVVFGGYKVSGNIAGVGEVNMGGDAMGPTPSAE